MNKFNINDLDFNNMGAWPIAVKAGFVVIVCLLILLLGYLLDLKGQMKKLDVVQKKETTLKDSYRNTYLQVVNLDAYKLQMKEMEATFGAMLRQLPGKTEVDALLVEISQKGLASGVEFKLFKPGSEKFVKFYAEMPIEITMTGDYHQFGSFVSGIASLPRIVTLHDIAIKAEKDSHILTMNVMAKTYRFLDQKEIDAYRASELKKKKGRRGRRG